MPGILYFNPLAPRGARLGAILKILFPPVFQSTSSSRSQTAAGERNQGGYGNFNPLAPRGARHIHFLLKVICRWISIH